MKVILPSREAVAWVFINKSNIFPENVVVHNDLTANQLIELKNLYKELEVLKVNDNSNKEVKFIYVNLTIGNKKEKNEENHE